MRTRMPIEPESIINAKERAEKIFEKEQARFALYFPSKKLAGVSVTSSRFDAVLKQFHYSLVGVYDPSCPFSCIAADIEAYYAECKSMAAKHRANCEVC